MNTRESYLVLVKGRVLIRNAADECGLENPDWMFRADLRETLKILIRVLCSEITIFFFSRFGVV